MPDSLTLVWGHSEHLQNFKFYDFQNSTPLPIFIMFQRNFIESILGMKKNIGCDVLAICQKLKKNVAL